MNRLEKLDNCTHHHLFLTYTYALTETDRQTDRQKDIYTQTHKHTQTHTHTHLLRKAERKREKEKGGEIKSTHSLTIGSGW